MFTVAQIPPNPWTECLLFAKFCVRCQPNWNRKFPAGLHWWPFLPYLHSERISGNGHNPPRTCWEDSLWLAFKLSVAMCAPNFTGSEAGCILKNILKLDLEKSESQVTLSSLPFAAALPAPSSWCDWNGCMGFGAWPIGVWIPAQLICSETSK